MDSTNPADFEAYLEQFPNGVFRLLAQNCLAAMREPAAGDRPAAGGPRGGGAAAPATAVGRIASTPADAPLRAGELRVFDGIEFVWVPAGEFRMGSTSLNAHSSEQPVTQVRISRGFWLGKHEVTQSEWQGVMGTNPSHFSGCAVSVRWRVFRGRMRRSSLGGSTRWMERGRTGCRPRRSGSTRRGRGRPGIAMGISTRSRGAASNGGSRTHPVGQKVPNACTGLLRHAGERVGVGRGLVRWLPGRHCDGSPGSRVGLEPGVSGRRLVRQTPAFAGRRFATSGSPGYRSDILGFRLLRTVPVTLWHFYPFTLCATARLMAAGKTGRRARMRPGRAENRPPGLQCGDGVKRHSRVRSACWLVW